MIFDRLKALWSGRGSTPSDQPEEANWTENLHEEIHFWDLYLRTRGDKWPEDFEFRCNPQGLFQVDIAKTLTVPPGSTLNILDVGAGPITYLGKLWPERTIQIVAVDPLAKEYDRLLKKYRIEPLVRTQFGHAEKLTEIFPPNTFDLITARNCIDHSYDPLLAVRQMVAVAKPDGMVYMDHFVNEAQRQKFGGLHQWNFFDRDGHFCIANDRETIDVNEALAGVAEITNELVGELIHTRLRKLK